MTTKEYTITGMTCGGCVAKVKKTLESVDGVQTADIQLNTPQGRLTTDEPLPAHLLADKLSVAGNYTITETKPAPKEPQTAKSAAASTKEKMVVATSFEDDLPAKSLTTYKPLMLIVAFIAGVTLLVQYPFDTFSGMLLDAAFYGRLFHCVCFL